MSPKMTALPPNWPTKMAKNGNTMLNPRAPMKLTRRIGNNAR